MAGYHVREIKKGIYGEVSKIREELEELEDALAQESKIMALVELSDLVGAIEAFAAKYGVTVLDLIVMSDITKRAFKSGHRTNSVGAFPGPCCEIDKKGEPVDPRSYFTPGSPHEQAPLRR